MGELELVNKLVLEYIPNGKDQGYKFSSSHDISKEDLKIIWQHALPNGRYWGRTVYQGARAVKSFRLGSNIVISESIVVSEKDAAGRKGLRRAEISILTSDNYVRWLNRKWLQTPPQNKEWVETKLAFLIRNPQYLDEATPKLSKRSIINTKPQIVMTYPYTNPEDWSRAESLVLRIASGESQLFLHHRISSFCSLSLDYVNEPEIVLVPLEIANLTSRKINTVFSTLRRLKSPVKAYIDLSDNITL